MEGSTGEMADLRGGEVAGVAAAVVGRRALALPQPRRRATCEGLVLLVVVLVGPARRRGSCGPHGRALEARLTGVYCHEASIVRGLFDFLVDCPLLLQLVDVRARPPAIGVPRSNQGFRINQSIPRLRVLILS